VRITNTSTRQTQQLTTNNSGYFEAVLLNPGAYEVRVELQGYKTLTRSGISLAVGQTATLTLTLEVGQVTEQVTVVAEAPLLDTSTVSSGQNFDQRMVEGPMFSNMPIMLSRFTPGVAPANEDVQNIFQGYMDGTTNAAGGQLGTGGGFDSRNTGNNYTIDGVSNNGFGHRIASSPNSDQIEEIRIETSNFHASQGHGTGLTVSMMTRGGTNACAARPTRPEPNHSPGPVERDVEGAPPHRTSAGARPHAASSSKTGLCGSISNQQTAPPRNMLASM
jgi:hypothetical protein